MNKFTSFLLLTACFCMLAACNSPRKLERALVYPEHITKLNLTRAGIKELPPKVGGLTNLEVLKMYKNRLTDLPVEIGEMESLRRLVLSGNNLESIPAEIGQLQNLEYLSLRYNELTKIPSEIGNLSALKVLDLRNNKIEELPASIGNLKNLQSLYLDYNELEAIPPQIGQMENLKFLYISFNSVSTNKVPEEFGNLQNLVELNLYKTGPMLNLPESIASMSRLEILTVDNSAVIPYDVGRMGYRLKLVVKP